MKDVDPARREKILKREAEDGIIRCLLSGYPLKLDKGDAEVEWLADMTFWVHLDRELVGARNENGFLIPSEVFDALDRWGIMDEDNRNTAKTMLDSMATGRNIAAMEEMKSK